MHECETCGSYCDCDGEDLHQPAPIDCTCAHEGSGVDQEDLPFDDDDPDESDYCHHGISFDEECEDCLEEEENEEDYPDGPY